MANLFLSSIVADDYCAYLGIRALAKAIYRGTVPSFTFWPPPFKFESAMLQSASATVFDGHEDLNIHARHTSSRKTVAVGTWPVFIRK